MAFKGPLEMNRSYLTTNIVSMYSNMYVHIDTYIL